MFIAGFVCYSFVIVKKKKKTKTRLQRVSCEFPVDLSFLFVRYLYIIVPPHENDQHHRRSTLQHRAACT